MSARAPHERAGSQVVVGLARNGEEVADDVLQLVEPFDVWHVPMLLNGWAWVCGRRAWGLNSLNSRLRQAPHPCLMRSGTTTGTGSTSDAMERRTCHSTWSSDS